MSDRHKPVLLRAEEPLCVLERWGTLGTGLFFFSGRGSYSGFAFVFHTAGFGCTLYVNISAQFLVDSEANMQIRILMYAVR